MLLRCAWSCGPLGAGLRLTRRYAKHARRDSAAAERSGAQPGAEDATTSRPAGGIVGISGGGIAGLVAGLQLAKHKVASAIVELAPHSRYGIEYVSLATVLNHGLHIWLACALAP